MRPICRTFTGKSSVSGSTQPHPTPPPSNRAPVSQEAVLFPVRQNVIAAGLTVFARGDSGVGTGGLPHARLRQRRRTGHYRRTIPQTGASAMPGRFCFRPRDHNPHTRTPGRHSPHTNGQTVACGTFGNAPSTRCSGRFSVWVHPWTIYQKPNLPCSPPPSVRPVTSGRRGPWRTFTMPSLAAAGVI